MLNIIEMYGAVGLRAHPNFWLRWPLRLPVMSASGLLTCDPGTDGGP